MSRGCCADGLSGRLRLADAAQFRLALEVAHVPLESGTQLSGRATEFTHNFPEIAGQLGKLLRPKYHQGHGEDDNQVWDAKHEGLNINR